MSHFIYYDFLVIVCNIYDQSIENQEPPHIVLDTTKWGLTVETVKLFTRSMGLPTVSASYGQEGDLKQWNGLNKNENKYLLQIMPPTDTIPHSVEPIVSENYIYDIAILYDETFIMDHKHRAILRQVKTRHVIASIADGKIALSNQIERLRKLDINHFLILGTLKNISKVLESVNPKYFGPNFVWYAVSQEEGTINVTEPTSYGDFDLRVFRDLTLNGLSYYRFNMSVSLLQIQGGNIIKNKIIGTLMAGPYPLYAVSNNDARKFYKANMVYRIFAVVQAPFIIRDDTAPNGYKGYCIDLINEIADILQFNYTIQEVEDGKFGNMNEKGEWNGVIRKLIDKEADIGLGSISVMAEREMVVDFTVPYYDLVGITIMMYKPNNTRSSSMFNFMTVLESNVWLCILGTYLFTSFIIWLFERLSPYSYQNNREKYQDNVDQIRVFTFKECLWFSITSLTSQGGGEVPKNISGRLLAAFWWLFGFIIIASYTANLSAFLTVTSPETSVKSLDDLSKQYKIDYAPLNDSMVLSYFQRMANVEHRFHKTWKNIILNDSLSGLKRSKLAVWDYPIRDKYNKMLKAIHKTPLPNSLEEAVSKVRNSSSANGFAFLGDATDIRYLVNTNCDLQIVGEEFSLKPYAIAIQMGSHLKNQFNNAILKLLNKRQLETLKEKWWSYAEEQIKCNEPANLSDGITLEDIGGIIIVIFGSIAVACIILTYELCWFKCRKNHNS
ncbi:ionotropic receptor 25a-like [Cochliomyia hominivorax]